MLIFMCDVHVRGQTQVSFLPRYHPCCFLRQGLLLSWILPSMLGWLVNKTKGICLFHPALVLEASATMSFFFFMWLGDQTQVPMLTGQAFPRRASPQACTDISQRMGCEGRGWQVEQLWRTTVPGLWAFLSIQQGQMTGRVILAHSVPPPQALKP